MVGWVLENQNTSILSSYILVYNVYTKQVYVDGSMVGCRTLIQESNLVPQQKTDFGDYSV